MKAYQLRDMATGLFDTGKLVREWSKEKGYGPTCIKWGKKGKVFKALNHLTLRLNHSLSEPVKSTWEIIEYELVETSRFSAATVAAKRK